MFSGGKLRKFTFDSIVNFDTARITMQTPNRCFCKGDSLRHEDSHVRFSVNNSRYFDNFNRLVSTATAAVIATKQTSRWI